MKEMPLPPMPQPIEQFRTSKDKALQTTKEARSKLFEVEKGKTYHEIYSKAKQGNYSIEYVYPENCNRQDICSLRDELIELGFKAEFKSGIYDSLKISWYE